MGNDIISCLSDSGCLDDDEQKKVLFYIDCNGTVREFNKDIVHNSNDELNFVSTLDSFIMKPNDEWYIVDIEWLSTWLLFARGVSDIPPGPISNKKLLYTSKKKKVMKLRGDLIVKTHYRCVRKEVWNYFFERYGGGPVIYFHGIKIKLCFVNLLKILLYLFSSQWL